MNRFAKTSRSFSLSLSILLTLSATGFSQDRVGVEGGEIRTGVQRDVTRIVVRSDSADVRRLLSAAFSVHGGYEIVSSMQAASFAVRVEAVGGAGARLAISSGLPERTLFTETLPGGNLREATLRAIDRAIFKTSGKPGFFSGSLTYVSKESGFPEIYTSDLLFGNVLKWTADGVDSVRPRWSPDGNYIVYTSYKNGFPDIHRLDLRNSRREVLVSFEGTNMGACYSPDGERIAMVFNGKVDSDLWVRESNGQFRNLTRSRGLESAPSWSPDGTRIVYSSDSSGGPQLYVIPSYGGSARRLRTDISGYCAEPDWNQVDPNKIAFTAAMGGGYQIAIFDMARGRSEFVTAERGDAIEAQWLNDGRHIIYTRRLANNHQIKILDTLTRRTATLSTSKTSVSQASFLAP